MYKRQVKYVIQRLIAAFFTFVVILIVVFFVLHSMPGDIIDFSPKLDPAIREMIMDKYHLNDSLIEQFQYTMADYLQMCIRDRCSPVPCGSAL